MKSYLVKTINGEPADEFGNIVMSGGGGSTPPLQDVMMIGNAYENSSNGEKMGFGLSGPKSVSLGYDSGEVLFQSNSNGVLLRGGDVDNNVQFDFGKPADGIQIFKTDFSKPAGTYTLATTLDMGLQKAVEYRSYYAGELGLFGFVPSMYLEGVSDGLAIYGYTGGIISAFGTTKIGNTSLDGTGSVELYIKAEDGVDQNLLFELPNTKPNGTYVLATIDDIVGGSVSVITKNASEINSLITSSGLIPGALYKISGAHPTLYDDGSTSGTTIFLLALSENAIAEDGYGIFYNPKYDKDQFGFGIWSNRSLFEVSNIVGTFQLEENITADNGATGRLMGSIYTDCFYALSGDWASAVSITGDVSSATADITDIVVKSYTIGDKAIWGGYSWTNVDGSVGNSTDPLTLDSSWTKDPYDNINYSMKIDKIIYDRFNDWITRRYDIFSANDVIFTYDDHLMGVDYGRSFSGISLFQFGNIKDKRNPDNTAVGIYDNIIIGSYFDCVNFQGSSMKGNRITNSTFTDNIISHNSFLMDCKMDAGTFMYNIMHSSKFSEVDGSVTIYNSVPVGQLDLKNSSMSNNMFLKRSNVYNLKLTNSHIDFNIVKNAYLSSSTLTDGYVDYNTIVNCGGIYNNIISSSGNISNNILIDLDYFLTYYTKGGTIIGNQLSNGGNISNNTFTSNLTGRMDINDNIVNNYGSIAGNTLSVAYNDFTAIAGNTISGLYGGFNNNNISSVYLRNNTLLNGAEVSSMTFNNGNGLNSCELKQSTLTARSAFGPALEYISFENVYLEFDTLLITNSSNIYSSSRKTVYMRRDGEFRIRHYDNTDTLSIVAIIP